jgi:hypothetical protein
VSGFREHGGHVLLSTHRVRPEFGHGSTWLAGGGNLVFENHRKRLRRKDPSAAHLAHMCVRTPSATIAALEPGFFQPRSQAWVFTMNFTSWIPRSS